MILKFSQFFAADVWLRLRSLILVEILKLGLVKILKFKFRDVAFFQALPELPRLWVCQYWCHV